MVFVGVDVHCYNLLAEMSYIIILETNCIIFYLSLSHHQHFQLLLITLVFTIPFSGSVVNTVERSRKMLSVRVSATIDERSLSNCFTRTVHIQKAARPKYIWSQLFRSFFAAENLVCNCIGITNFIKVFSVWGLLVDSLVRVDH